MGFVTMVMLYSALIGKSDWIESELYAFCCVYISEIQVVFSYNIVYFAFLVTVDNWQTEMDDR